MTLLRLVAVRTRLPTIDGTPSASAMSVAIGNRGNANYAGIRMGLLARFMRPPSGVGRLTSVGFRLFTVKVGSRERRSLTSRPSRSRNEHVEGNRGGGRWRGRLRGSRGGGRHAAPPLQLASAATSR